MTAEFALAIHGLVYLYHRGVLITSEELADNLENGTFEEVRNALEVCFSMMDISAFQCVSSMRNVSMLAAKPKQ